jgi:deoxyribodipyrimidine photo-lyase
MNITLYWITQDMRLDDNPALMRAVQSDVLICTFSIDRRWFNPLRYHVQSMGSQRWRFLTESLSDLANSLEKHGQHLQLLFGYSEHELAKLINKHKITRLVCARQFGVDERRILSNLAGYFPALLIEEVDAGTLFDKTELPCSLMDLRKGFTPFRTAVSQMTPAPTLQAPVSLSRPPLRAVSTQALPDWLPEKFQTIMLSPAKGRGSDFNGGETAALQHAAKYFLSGGPDTYKSTRDQLDGWDNSTKFSPWLAHGNISARRITQMLKSHESVHGSNESTQWLYFELLWREYFQWLALSQGSRLFSLRGLRDKPPHACLHPERYQKWCHGSTPWPLVNACMRQLKQTGYLSNRGRQLVASCYINELGMDWRYGAAWFEHNLVDYDVAVNWGNWQYIAGVGVDPRGGRHFNLEKQAALYDPLGDYIARWAPEPAEPVLDSVDAADWPVY